MPIGLSFNQDLKICTFIGASSHVFCWWLLQIFNQHLLLQFKLMELQAGSWRLLQLQAQMRVLRLAVNWYLRWLHFLTLNGYSTHAHAHRDAQQTQVSCFINERDCCFAIEWCFWLSIMTDTSLILSNSIDIENRRED